MERTSGSSFRAAGSASGTASPSPDSQDAAPCEADRGPCIQHPGKTRARLLPGEPPEPHGPGQPLDGARIVKGAVSTAIGQGSCFAFALATINHLRVKGAAHPWCNVIVGGMLPALAGYMTAPGQRAACKTMDYRPTQMPSDSLAHDAIPSFVIYGVNKAYARAAFLPKPVPGTPAAAFSTLMVSLVSTGLSGAISEATAQWAGGHSPPLPDDDEMHRKGIGRAYALLPMGPANVVAARYVAQLGKVPDHFKTRPLEIALIGWACRNWLMPVPVAAEPLADPGPQDGAPPHATLPAADD